ncbi:MAG: flagellar export protein FliJ [Hyphomicrobiales bacterium]|nr:flagellar export protein FliJ [Hyphomicrobiales bacterium]MBV9518474.1 flagellar export protein FliJ [Hyphomicrobiales bacterium]
MKTRGSLIRLKRFAADEKSRNLTRIETMIREFSKDSAELDREIAAEEARAGITDPKHFAYPTYAKAATQRRDNLRRSVEDLRLQLEEARAEYEDALADLKKMEALDERERTLETPRGETSNGFAMARA